MDLQIQTIHFDADQNLKQFTKKKVGKLETFYKKIVNAEVFLKLENDGSSVRNKIAEVRLQVPGATLFATEKSKVFEESIDLAINSLRKQLGRHKEKFKK